MSAKKASLSIEQYKLLDDAYRFFNHRLFKDELPECMIVMHRKKNSRGYFHAERYIERKGKGVKKSKNVRSVDELAMNPDDFSRPDIAILSTLVHEMCHVWQYRCCDKQPRGGYHDKVWASKMEEVGLMPSTTGMEGGKRTGQKVTHYIIQSGKFETSCLKFLKGKSIKLSSFPLPAAESSAKEKTKYCCPSCDLKIWGKPGLNVQCGDCGETLEEA